MQGKGDELMNEMKREEVLARFKEAKRRKHEIVSEMEKTMKEQYERETGKKANYFFVL